MPNKNTDKYWKYAKRAKNEDLKIAKRAARHVADLLSFTAAELLVPRRGGGKSSHSIKNRVVFVTAKLPVKNGKHGGHLTIWVNMMKATEDEEADGHCLWIPVHSKVDIYPPDENAQIGVSHTYFTFNFVGSSLSSAFPYEAVEAAGPSL